MCVISTVCFIDGLKQEVQNTKWSLDLWSVNYNKHLNKRYHVVKKKIKKKKKQKLKQNKTRSTRRKAIIASYHYITRVRNVKSLLYSVYF